MVRRKSRRCLILTSYCVLLAYFVYSTQQSARTVTILPSSLTEHSWLESSETAQYVCNPVRSAERERYMEGPSVSTTRATKVTLGTVIAEFQIRDSDGSEYRSAFRSLLSFSRLFSVDNMVIMSESFEVCKIVQVVWKLDVKCASLRHCSLNDFHQPTMPCVFKTLLANAKMEDIVFVNSDIVLYEDFVQSLNLVQSSKSYLMIGQRTNLYVGKEISNSLAHLKQAAIGRGRLDGEYALDYFAFRKGDFPVFKTKYIVGNWRWDNALLLKFYSNLRVTVFDATAATTVVHQSQYDDRQPEDRAKRPAGEHNDQLAKLHDKYYRLGSVKLASVNLRRENGSIVVDDSYGAASDVVRQVISTGEIVHFEEKILRSGIAKTLASLTEILGYTQFETCRSILRSALIET